MAPRRARRFFLLPLLLLPLVVGVSQEAAPRDLTVEAAVELALANSGSILIKRHEEKKSSYALAEAWGRLFPTFTVQASGSYMTNPPEGITIQRGSLGYAPTYNSPAPTPLPDRDYVLMEDTEDTYFSMSGTLTQPLFTWFKLKNAIDIAAADYEIARMNTAQTRQEQERDVRIAYFGAVLSRDSLAILEGVLATATEILEDRRRSFAEGIINRYTLLQAESTLAAMEEQLSQAREGHLTGIETLSFLTGTDMSSATLVSDFRRELPEFDEHDLRDQSTERSLDVDIARSRLRQARTYLAIERGNIVFLPDISLIVKVDVTGQRIPILGANWTDSWDTNVIVSLGTRTTVFDGLQSVRKVQQASEQVETAVIGLSQLERSLALRVRKAVEAARTSHAALLHQDARLREVQEQYKNARVSYENELITRTEERGARILLLTTELEQRFSLFNFEKSLVELEHLVGGLEIDG